VASTFRLALLPLQLSLSNRRFPGQKPEDDDEKEDDDDDEYADNSPIKDILL